MGEREGPVEAPRFWHEPWVGAFLLVALPPLGWLAITRSPQVDEDWKRVLKLMVGVLVLSLVGTEVGTGALSSAWRHGLGFLSKVAARGLLRAGRLDDAKRAADRARRLLPEDRSVAWTSAAIAAADGDGAGELALLEQAVGRDDPGVRAPPQWTVALGRAYLERGDLEGVDRCLESLKGYAGRAAGGATLRAARLLAAGKASEAEDAARRVILDFDVSTFADAYEEVARSRAARERWEEAAYFALEAFRHDPTREHLVAEVRSHVAKAGGDHVPWRAFRQACWIRGPIGGGQAVDSEAADRLAGHVLERYPDFAAGDLVLHSRGSYWFYEKKDHERALGFYREGLERFPAGETRCRTLHQSARCLIELERFEEAVAAARQVQDECPGDLAGAARGLEARARRRAREKDGKG